MTKDTLENLIYDALAEQIAQRVVEKLIELKKRALVVFTGSTMGFPRALESLKRMREDGYVFQVVLSESASHLLDVTKIEEALRPEKLYVGEQETAPEMIAAPFDTIIVPSMTINTVAKVTSCICDTVAARIISNSMMRGKDVIVAIDGCCPDNEERAAKGYKFAPALKEHLRGNLEKLRAFGATLTLAERLDEKAKTALRNSFGMGAKPEQKAAAPAAPSAPAALAATGQAAGNGGVHVNKKVIGRTDIVGNLQCSAIYVPKGALVTQLAKDLAAHHGIQLIRE